MKFGAFLLSGTFLFFLPNAGQDLQSLSNAHWISGSGRIAARQIYYNASGKNASRKPFTSLIQGNLNLKFFGFIDAPFQFVYSNTGSKYTQPTFNQTAIHPSYKWVKTHFGTISATYSPYTLNGHVFNGAALDLLPGKFQFSICYGQFQKASQPVGQTAGLGSQAAFKRTGGGLKMGISDPKFGSLYASIFYAKDHERSIVIPEQADITPQQNTAISLSAEKTIGKKLRIKAEVGHSLLTSDTRMQSHKEIKYSRIQFSSLNQTTQAFSAMKIESLYSFHKINFNCAYERVEPGYRSLGAYYFNSDLENFTVGFSAPFASNKIHFSIQGGVQKDNLDKTKISQMKRFVGNTNLSIKPSNKLYIVANYSNFTTVTNLRPYGNLLLPNSTYAEWDTLNFRQISQNGSSNVQYTLKSDSLKSTGLGCNLNLQKTQDLYGKDSKNAAQIMNVTLSWFHRYLKSSRHYSISVNLGNYLFKNLNYFTITPLASAKTTFFKNKMTGTLQAGLTRIYYSYVPNQDVWNIRNTWETTLQKVHHFSISALYLHKISNQNSFHSANTFGFKEYTILFAYNMSTAFFNSNKRKYTTHKR